MARTPYDHVDREGILSIAWNDFHSICRALAAGVSRFGPEIVLSVLRVGLYPGALIARILQVDLYPIRLSRRDVDTVKFKSPRWLIEPPAEIAGRRVLVVDEICDTGETIRIAKERVERLGA